MRRGFLAALLGAIGLTVLPQARAFGQEAEEAEALIRQAMEFRRQDQDAKAVPLLEKAHKLSRTPRTAAQLGLVEMALGYWIDAERYLNDALAQPDHPWIAKNRGTLEDARTRVRGMIGEVTITGEPEGAAVVVNGREVGRLPLSRGIRLGKGTIEIEMRAPGYATASRSVTLTGGAREHVNLTLAPAAVSSPSPSTALSGGQAGANRSVVGPVARTPLPSVDTAAPTQPTQVPALPTGDTRASGSGSTGPARSLAWVAGAGAVGGLAFGIVETVLAQKNLNTFNNHTSPSPTPEDPNRRVLDCTTSQLSAECKGFRDSYDQAKTLAVVGYVVGGTLAVASAALFLLSAPTGENGNGLLSRAALGCAPNPAFAGFTCRLKF